MAPKPSKFHTPVLIVEKYGPGNPFPATSPIRIRLLSPKNLRSACDRVLGVYVFLPPKFSPPYEHPFCSAPCYFEKAIKMKRLVITSVIVATLTLSGCAGGFLGSSNCSTSSSPGLFESGGLFSDGPVRRFLRGDSCDECNAPAGQLQAPPCDPCFDTSTIVPNGNWALPSAPGAVQPVTSFYSDSGLSSAPFEQEVLPGELTLPPASLPQSLPGLSPAGSGSTFSAGSLGADLTEPPLINN